jgi:hypothetical protein
MPQQNIAQVLCVIGNVNLSSMPKMQLDVVNGPLVSPTCQWEEGKSPSSSTTAALLPPAHAVVKRPLIRGD